MNDQLSALKTKLDSASSLLLVLPSTPTQDVVAAGLALYLSLKQSGKTIAIVANTAPTVRDSHLVGLDKITTELGGNNLVITLNVPEDTVDKVTSNTEGGHLNLIINPRPGASPVTDKDVTFSYSGASADLVLVLGSADLKDLGALAERENALFTPDKIINISNQVGNFGTINLTDPSSSNSELVTALIQELSLPLDIDIANNLMQGIEAATSGLSSPSLTADTFEALAVLYRAGARRQTATIPVAEAKIVADMPIIDNPPATPSLNQPKADWLQPKIFKGSQSH